MDIVTNAINRNQHLSKNENLNSQTWEKFEKAIQHKKVFLFGVSSCADIFFERYVEINLCGVIDNDVNKQGLCVGDFLSGVWGKKWGETSISNIDVLNKYLPDEVIVLITSTNFYEEIVRQLEQYGIFNYFVLLIMEANRRKNGENLLYESVSVEQNRILYAKKYSQEPINPKKIVFYSFGTYSDHGKYITQKLLFLRTDLDIVWFVKNPRTRVPDGVRKVYMSNWKKYLYELETARIWIYNMVVPRYVIKRPEQIYIQTKHWSSVTLKRFYLDSATIQGESDNVDNWKYNSEIMDYIITGSDFDTTSSRRGFGFRKEVIQIGSPRSDALFCKDKYKQKVYDFYNMNLSVQTLIYSPTYRFDKSNMSHMHEARGIDLDFEAVKRALEQRFGGIWYIMLRLHPSVAKESCKIEKPDYVIDASNYEDSEELVAACDIMISDYSSIMFEPAFVKKPVFLFATDKRDYIDKEYDLLIDYNCLPFSVAESNVELVKNIELFNQIEYEKNVDAFMEQYGVHEDGHASERAALFISDLIGKGDQYDEYCVQ